MNRLLDLSEHEPALRRIIAEHNGELIGILQAIQRQFDYLPRNALELVAEALSIPVARVWGVATFYRGFLLEPRGRHMIRVCCGTACHVRGARRVVEAMAKHIGVDPAGGTSDDLEHTLDTVACIGCCSLAPVVTIDDEIHGKLDQQQAVELLADVILDEEAP